MGLTIYYQLEAKGTDAQARKIVESLHQTAHDLPVKKVSHIVDLSGDECDFDKLEKVGPLSWLLWQAGENLRLKDNRPTRSGEKADAWIRVPPTRLIAFTVCPGEGCEAFSFGLCQFPAEILHPNLGTLKTKMSGWRWNSFCKTQYASDPNRGGVQNFLRCHLSVIALLDKAKVLGCLKDASDDGGFWANRNVETLVKEINRWNQTVAAFGGKIKDIFGDGVGMPISEYPNFEQLEMAGQNKLPPQIEELARLIKQVRKKH